ncbi:MAG: nucleotidyl transferase AbiEii/AbiGii toxin family protein [Gemmatimonadales bacterium]
MITSRAVLETAAETGFRPDVVEKVLRLRGILDRLDKHPSSRGMWVLKGGTALNLLHLDVPRLSVDIDVNFIGAEDVEGMRRARPDFERGLTACCEREGCSVRRTPSEHAGGKFRLRFPSVLGGSQNLEVDVSYVARVPLLGTERRPTRFPPGSEFEVLTLALEELAAGKFTALLQRSVVRDAFDAASLLELAPDLLARPGFRLAFVCSLAASRNDCRSLRVPAAALDARAIARELEPMLRRTAKGEAPDCDDLMAWIDGKLRPVRETLLAWSEGERRFLDRLLDEGEIEPEHLDPDRAVQDRVRMQPMLQWKARNVREHRGRS